MLARPEPIEVGRETQLFLDDMFFAATSGVQLNVNRPFDAGTAIQADRPWENGETACTWCTVLRDPEAGQVRMYYLGSATLGFKPSGKTKFMNSLCCAVSDDGITWEKPGFDVCDFQGSTDNNIVFANFLDEGQETELREMGTVVIDENDVPERRYKMTFFPKGCLMRAAYSPDGIHWTIANDGRPIVRQAADSQNIFFWDNSVGRWVGYLRVWAGGRRVGRIETDDFESVARSDPRVRRAGP